MSHKVDGTGLEGWTVGVTADRRAEEQVELLVRRGARVMCGPVSQGQSPDDEHPHVMQRPRGGAAARRLVVAVCEHRLDAVTFTSSSALIGCIEIAARLGLREQLLDAFGSDVVVATIGPVCSEKARSRGIVPAVEPLRHRLGAMVNALERHAREIDNSRTKVLGRQRVVLRASTVTFDRTVVELAARERAVLAVLLQRPGHVVAKERIRTRAWCTPVDGHAVEVTIARLRTRLAGFARVVAVPKRGYRVTPV